MQETPLANGYSIGKRKALTCPRKKHVSLLKLRLKTKKGRKSQTAPCRANLRFQDATGRFLRCWLLCCRFFGYSFLRSRFLGSYFLSCLLLGCYFFCCRFFGYSFLRSRFLGSYFFSCWFGGCFFCFGFFGCGWFCFCW